MAITSYRNLYKLHKLKYLDTIRERLRCHKVGGRGAEDWLKSSKNGWVTNNREIGRGRAVVNKCRILTPMQTM